MENLLEIILSVAFVLVALLMTFLILLQEGKGGGLSALGGTKAASVEGVTNPIRRATGWLAGIWFVLAIVLGALHSSGQPLTSQADLDKQAAAREKKEREAKKDESAGQAIPGPETETETEGAPMELDAPLVTPPAEPKAVEPPKVIKLDPKAEPAPADVKDSGATQGKVEPKAPADGAAKVDPKDPADAKPKDEQKGQADSRVEGEKKEPADPKGQAEPKAPEIPKETGGK